MKIQFLRLIKFIRNFFLNTFVKYLFLILFIIIGSLTYIFYVNDNCKSLKFFLAYKDLGIEHIRPCFSKGNLNNKIKKVITKSPLIFEYARSIKRNRFGGSNQDILSFEDNSNLLENRKDLPKYKYEKGLLYKENNQLDNFNNNEQIIENSSWTRSHGGNWNTHFSNSNLINKKNIKRLDLIWKRTSIKQNDYKSYYKQNIELNPIVLNKKLIYITSDWKIEALEATTGKKIWDIDLLFQPSRRGIVGYINKKKEEFLFIPIAGRIYKINAKNGKLVKSFGNKGSIGSSTIVAPMIYDDSLVSVSIKRYVEVFDINSGKKKFDISVHGERNFSGGAPWGGAALDKTKGVVYIVTGNPLPSLYGVNRPGANKNTSSIVAFDLNARNILWAFQDVRHDLWDYDIASPPLIHNLEIEDKLFETVIALTKTGNVILLDRNNGKPIFDLRYRKAPISDVPNEVTSKYQLDLEKPEKFSKIEFKQNDFDKLPKEKVEEIKKIIKKSKIGWFEAPSFKKDLIIFGLHGGAQWPGGAIDPYKHELFIPTNNIPWKLRLYLQSMEQPRKNFIKDQKTLKIYYEKCASCHGKNRNGIKNKFGEKLTEYVPSLVGLSGRMAPVLFGKKYFDNKFDLAHHEKFKDLDLNKLKLLFAEWDNHLYENKLIRVENNIYSWTQFLTDDDLPASNPPWGYIAKINLTSGNLEWKKPIGKRLVNNVWVETGSTIFGGVVLNKSGVLFVTGTSDNFVYGIDSDTGKELWSYKMEASGSAPPILYEIDGRQYLSIISTGGAYNDYKEKGSTIYTFAIR